MTTKAKRAPVYAPSMSDEAVKAKTGKTWTQWFALLDKAKAATMTHGEIASRLHEKHGVPGWWSQMVTVEYERARGLREKHETAAGYSVGVSKTIATPLSALYAAAADAGRREKWFPGGGFKLSSQRVDKYLRGSWGAARLEIGFYAKGDAKSQIAVQVNKLSTRSDVERVRAAWKEALTKLEALLAGAPTRPSAPAARSRRRRTSPA